MPSLVCRQNNPFGTISGNFSFTSPTNRQPYNESGGQGQATIISTSQESRPSSTVSPTSLIPQTNTSTQSPSVSNSPAPDTSSSSNVQTQNPSFTQAFATETTSIAPLFQTPSSSQSLPYFVTGSAGDQSSIDSSVSMMISPTATPTTETNFVKRQGHQTAIAGAAVGGVVAFAILLFAGYMLVRRRRKRRRNGDGGPNPDEKDENQAKTYWNLDRQEGEVSPPGFFPKEYTGEWPAASSPQPRSSPNLV